MNKLTCWDSFHYSPPTHTYKGTCQSIVYTVKPMNGVDGPVGCVSEKLAQCDVGPARQVVQRHLSQHEPADLRCALQSDAASAKNTVHFQTRGSVFKDFLDLDSPSRQDGLHDESSWLALILQWMVFMEEKDLNPHP